MTLAAASAVSAAPPPGHDPWRFECRPGSPGETRTSTTCGATVSHGSAIAPPGAPQPVKDAIEAANRLVGRPYVWGGGHLSWSSEGYDCSGAVGYVLHGGGLLERTMVSGELERWGKSGVGRWITVYANWHHVYMVVAGLRFDTRDNPLFLTGPKWHLDMPEPKRFAARHAAGF